MYWKELNISLKKYCTYAVLVIAIIMISLKFTQTEEASESLNVMVAVLEDDTVSRDYLRSNFNDFKIIPVKNRAEGNRFAGNADTFFYYNRVTDVFDVIINPTRANAELISNIFRQSMNQTDFTLEVLEKSNAGSDAWQLEDLKGGMSMFLTIASVAFILISYNLYTSEKHTLDMIIYSPEKTNHIFHAKLCIILFLNVLLCSYYGISVGLPFSIGLLIFFLMMLYSFFGFIFAVMSEKKYITVLFWLLFLFLVISQMFILRVLDITSLKDYFDNGVRFIVTAGIAIMVLGACYFLILRMFQNTILAKREGR